MIKINGYLGILLIASFFLYIKFGGSAEHEAYILKSFKQVGTPVGVAIYGDGPSGGSMAQAIIRDARYIYPSGKENDMRILNYYKKQFKKMGWESFRPTKNGVYYWCSKNTSEGKYVFAEFYPSFTNEKVSMFTFQVARYAWIGRTSVHTGSMCNR